MKNDVPHDAPLRFDGDFTHQDPLPDEAIAAANAVLGTARLHRYNLEAGEVGEVAAFEEEYAKWQGSRFALAVASGGQAMQIALRAAGVKVGDKILTNAFTLAPVPSAIVAVGAQPLLVEIDENLRLDLDDFQQKATQSQFLLLSHMRGHLVDMERLMAIANAHNITVIEDCAHTMGAKWNGVRSGNFGHIAAFSTQTYKHINSGEGGVLVTNDEVIAAKAIVMSGSYMNFLKHGARPHDEVFEKVKLETPNFSARIDALRAAILRPQLAVIDKQIDRWNARYEAVEAILSKSNSIHLPKRPEKEDYVGSSIQFRCPSFGKSQCAALVENLALRGVDVKWFGRNEPIAFTSTHDSWHYVSPQTLPRTDEILSTTFDMRIPLRFSLQDCETIANIILDETASIARSEAPES